MPGAPRIASRNPAGGIARLVTGNALEQGDPGRTAALRDEVTPGDAAALDVVRTDVRIGAHPRLCRRSLVDPVVDDDDGNAGTVRLADGRHDFLGPRRADHEHANAGLDQVLDDLHLLFDVDLALGRLHREVDADACGGGFGSPSHVEEERTVQRLEDESDAGPITMRAAAAERGHGEHEHRHCGSRSKHLYPAR